MGSAGPAMPWEGVRGGGAASDVFPEGGRLALFFIDEVPHEVRPTFHARHALTLWYYDRGERAEAVGRGGAAVGVDAATQREAQGFVRALVRGERGF